MPESNEILLKEWRQNHSCIIPARSMWMHITYMQVNIFLNLKNTYIIKRQAQGASDIGIDLIIINSRHYGKTHL